MWDHARMGAEAAYQLNPVLEHQQHLGEPPRRAAFEALSTPSSTGHLVRSGVLRDRYGAPLTEPRGALAPRLARGYWTDTGVWHEMLRSDGVVQGVLVLFAWEILRARLRVKTPPDADPAERRGRDLLAWWLGLDGFDDRVPGGRDTLLFQLALSMVYGFSLMWARWGIQGGPERRSVTTPLDLCWVAPWSVEGWHWSDGRPVGVEQITSETPGGMRQTQTIAASDLIWHGNWATDGNPEGVSQFRPAWGPWRLKQEEMSRDASAKQRLFFGVNLIEQEGDASGPWGSITKADLDVFTNLFQRSQRGEVSFAFTPLGLKVRQSNPQFQIPDPTNYLRYLDNQILTGCTSGFLGLDTTAGGTRALSEGYAGVLYNAIESFADRMLRSLMGIPGRAWLQLGREIVRRNIPEASSPEYRMPKLVSVGLAQQDLRTWADLVSKLAQFRYVTPDEYTEAQAREMSNLEERSIEDLRRIRATAEPARASEIDTQSPQGPQSGGAGA